MKKICSILLALILAIMPLTLCAAESTEKVTLNYYGWTDEQSYMTALINMFNEQNPDVEIVPTFVNHDDYNQKIVVLASSDSSVMDLVSCDSQATVLNLVTLDGLLPLKDRIEAAGIDMSAILTYDKEGAAVLKDGLNQFTPYGQINLVNAINTQHPELAEGISGWMNVDYHFLGIDLGASASDALGMIKSGGLTWAAVGIIVMVLLAAASQVANMKISMMGQPQQAAANATNKTMMLIMPLMTLWIGYTLPAALSLYWLAQSVFSAIQDLILNKAYLRKIREAEEARAKAITEDRKARQEEARQRQIQQQAEAKERQRERNRQIQEARKKGGQKKASTTEAGRVGDRPYARGRAYREHDDE